MIYTITIEGTAEQELAFAIDKWFKTTKTVEEKVELFDEDWKSAWFNTETKEVDIEYTRDDVQAFIKEFLDKTIQDMKLETFTRLEKAKIAEKRAEEDRILEESIKAQVLESQK